jgi:uncharacterized Ntn-hydrolase superfamily protein
MQYVFILFTSLLASLPLGIEIETGSIAGTFSIAAFDPQTGELGIAVASRVPFVGHDVPWALADNGAIATQAWVNQQYGPDGLALLLEGHSASDVVVVLVSADPDSAIRQLGIVDAAGGSASFTGSETNAWAGGVTGPGYAIQGNILVSEDVIREMEKAFLETEGPLSRRLLEALKAGEAAGGDSRGKQSAALLVVRSGGGHDGASDRFVDIQVSDHIDPVPELERLYGIWEGYNVFPVYIDSGSEPETTYALEILDRVLDEEEPDPDLYNYYAWTLAERRLFPERALEIAAAAHEMAPEDHNIIDTLAESCYAAGDPLTAVIWEKKALELDPENAFYISQLQKFEEAAAALDDPTL